MALMVWPHRGCRIDGMATRPWIVMVWQHGHWAHGAPWAPSSPVVVRRNFEKLTKIDIFPIWGSKMGQKKMRLRGRDPPSQNRAAILRLGVVSMSQMVARRPIWWQKGWFGGTLGFRAAPAHPWALGPGPGTLDLRLLMGFRQGGSGT